MEKLTRNDLKNVLGGGDPLPPGCVCFVPIPDLPGGMPDPDCYWGDNPQLYCQPAEWLLCC
ncbi:MAG TPA: hypothetical protein VIM55_16355 [Mucilaginibacter sp.]